MKVYRINKSNMLIGIWFSAFAVICIATVVFWLVSWANFSKNALSTDGVIIDIRGYYNRNSKSTEYDVIVEYTVGGVLYTRSLGYYSSAMEIGQTVTVIYDSEDPDHMMSKPYFECAVIAIFILVFGGAGTIFIVTEILNMQRINRLADEDKYIICDHTCEREEVSAHVKVNRVYYRQTNFIYRDMYGREYVFSSRPYHPEKNPFLDGQSVTVYVDIEKDPKKYYISSEK